MAGGQGYTVRLYQAELLIDSQVVGQDLGYRFAGLAPGTYRIEAIGPCLQRDQIELSGENPEARVYLSV